LVDFFKVTRYNAQFFYSFHCIYHQLFCISEHFSRILSQPLQISGANYSWHTIDLIKIAFPSAFVYTLSSSKANRELAKQKMNYILTLTCLDICTPLSLALSTSPLLHYRRTENCFRIHPPAVFFESLMNSRAIGFL
jgi:hypothetical protein